MDIAQEREKRDNYGKMGHFPTPGGKGDQIDQTSETLLHVAKKKAASFSLREKEGEFGITVCVQPHTKKHLLFCNGDLFLLAGYKKRDYATVQT